MVLDVFSEEVASSLNLLVADWVLTDHANAPVEFFKIISRWFLLVANRYPSRCFHSSLPEMNQNSYEFQGNGVTIFARMVCVDGRKKWLGLKPIQTGLILTTHSCLELCYDRLLEGYKFVIQGRNSIATLESYFSLLRKYCTNNSTSVHGANATRLHTASQAHFHKHDKQWCKPHESLIGHIEPLPKPTNLSVRKRRLNECTTFGEPGAKRFLGATVPTFSVVESHLSLSFVGLWPVKC